MYNVYIYVISIYDCIGYSSIIPEQIDASQYLSAKCLRCGWFWGPGDVAEDNLVGCFKKTHTHIEIL